MRGSFFVFCVWVGFLACGSIPTLANGPTPTRRDIDPVDFGAVGDGVADDTASVMAADSRAVVTGMRLRLTKNYRMRSSQTLASNVVFQNGKIIVDEGSTVVINGNISAPDIAHLFVGNIATPKAPFVSVAWWGALVSADAAPAFRAAVGGNRVYLIPPGTYTLSSYVDDCLPGATIGPQVIINICYISNLHIRAYGAKINTVPDPVKNRTQILMFQGDRNFSVEGGTWQGSLSSGNLRSRNTLVAALFNSADFSFKNMHLTKRYTQGFVGDFDANGRFSNIQIDRTWMGFDLAYQQNLSFDHITATGIHIDGTPTPGRSMISLIHDPPNLPFRTLLFEPITKNISVSNSSASNFSFTYHIADGYKYSFTNNVSNGTHESYDYYIATSSGRSVGNINIIGATSIGFKSSLYFVTRPLGRGQYFHDVHVSASTFSNDLIGVDADDDAKKVTNMNLDTNLSFHGNDTNVGSKLKPFSLPRF